MAFSLVVLAWLVWMTVSVILDPNTWPLLVLPAGFGLIIHFGLRSHNKGTANNKND
ncbi:MAG: hypothetical protein V3T86_13245 [Planctomycetota bacterium]